MILKSVILAAALASGGPLKSLQEESRIYEQCILREALLLEPSGDQASTVLDAAVIACRKNRERLSEAFWVEKTLKEGEPPSDARVERLMVMADKEFRNRALAALLRQRAKRKSKNAPNQ